MMFSDAVEVLPGRLYWVSTASRPSDTAQEHFFSIDDTLLYEPFAEDFGPLSLACVTRYCRMLEEKLVQPSYAGQKLYHTCGTQPQRRTNAVGLICAYQVVVLGRTPEAAIEPFRQLRPPFMPWRDALTNKSTFDLDILDVLRGLRKAVELGWYNWRAFSVESFEWFSQVEHGDLNWIIPGKFIAFTGPQSHEVDSDGWKSFTPEDYLKIFKKAGVGLVVRLNSKQYDRNRFINNGVKHIDLYFKDGSCPPPTIIDRFLHVCEAEPGAVAVHCKAGLGRTGTLIGLYAMKHYGFPARAFIAWNRLCRPGSILGPQQQYMVSMQEEMFRAGRECYYPQMGTRQSPVSMPMPDKQQQQQQERERAEMHTDVGQGERLCNARRGGQSPKSDPLGPGDRQDKPPTYYNGSNPLTPFNLSEAETRIYESGDSSNSRKSSGNDSLALPP